MIRAKRQERFWTQQLLADAARVSLRTVQRAEQGQRCAKESILAIMGALDMEMDSVMLTPEENVSLFHQWMSRLMQSLKVIIKFGGIAYLVLLVLVVTFMAIRFSALFSAPRPADLDAFYALFGTYIKLLNIAAICLGIWMAVVASGIGIAYRALWKGLLALAVAGALALIGFAFLPWVQYPNDQYSPAMILIFTCALPVALCWSLVTLMLRRAVPGRVRT